MTFTSGNDPAAGRMTSLAQSSDELSMEGRMCSVAGGAVLALAALRRLSPVGVALAAAGGYLLYRGTVGRCPLTEIARDAAARAQEQLEVSMAEQRGLRQSSVRRQSDSDAIDESSEESFPASDPPSWTPTV